MELPSVDNVNNLQLLLGLGLVGLCALVYSVLCSDWKNKYLDGDIARWIASVCGLAILWHLRAAPPPGLQTHFLGAAFMVLAFGPRLAFLGLGLALCSVSYSQAADWAAFPLNLFFSCAMPAALCRAVHLACLRWLPKNPFVYIFVCAGFASALSMFASSALAVLAMDRINPFADFNALSDMLVACLLLSFGEAWINAILVAAAVCFSPALLCTWSDEEWLGKNGRSRR